MEFCDLSSGDRALGGKFRLLALAQIRFALRARLAIYRYGCQHRKRAIVARKLHKAVQINLAQEPNVIEMIIRLAGGTFVELLQITDELLQILRLHWARPHYALYLIIRGQAATNPSGLAP